MKTYVAAFALALLLGSAPAAAEQARTSMSVTATVVPGCSRAGCSSGASVTTMTATRADERPLAEAEALLGAPVRRRGMIVFTALVASPAAADADQSGTRYLTLTY